MDLDLATIISEAPLPKEFEISVSSGAAIFLRDDEYRHAREEWHKTRDELLRRGYILFEYRSDDTRTDRALFKHESICTTAELEFRNSHPELYRPLLLP